MSVKPVRLLDIAHRCGVSLAAVSMGLSGKGAISEVTRARIRAVAEEMGYSPNLQASALASLKNGTAKNRIARVAVLFADKRPSLWTDERQRLNKQAAGVGVQFDVFRLHDFKNASALSRTLQARGYEGIILDRMMRAVSLEGMRWEHFSVVCSGRYLQEFPFDAVRESEGAKLRRMLRETRARGYRRIGIALLRHAPVIEDDLDREAELQLYQQSLSASERVEPHYDAGINSCYDNLCRWFNKERPDALIAFSSHYYHIIRDLNPPTLPRFGFASLHVWPVEVAAGLITGFRTGEILVAEKALEYVSNLIRHNVRGVPSARTETLIPTPWVEGSTLKHIQATPENTMPSGG